MKELPQPGKKTDRRVPPRVRLPVNVVNDGLCVRCGFCLDICPFGLVSPDERFFPTMSPDCLERCTGCGLCVKGCPGDVVDFVALYQRLFGKVPEPRDINGVIDTVYVGYSLNRQVRLQGSSGGVVTELLCHLLREGFIDQALVCGMNPEKPWEPDPVLARSEEEILAATQSKYTIVPQMRRISRIIKSRKKTAIVGLPCQLHAFRKFEATYSRISEKVPVLIGLVCHSTLEIEATSKLLQLAGIKPEHIARLEYRGGEWPGVMRAHLKNGETRSLHSLNAMTAFRRLSLLYTPERCLTCIDHTAEFSDLSIMDPCIRDEKGRYPYTRGYSLVIARTQKAVYLLNHAMDRGSLYLEEISPSMLASQLGPMIRKKKINAPIRMDRLRKRGRPYPSYNVSFPPATFHDKLLEIWDCLKRIPGRRTWTRDLGARLLFSEFGDYLMKAKEALKQRKHAFQTRRS
ncbi:MAG: Coenzyme F420 hydrogenase/dehydrogenase, beta subunit C-terminal domain [Desulfosoma sp.]